MYSFTLSHHLSSGPPLKLKTWISLTFFHKIFTPHSLRVAKLLEDISFHLFYYSPLHIILHEFPWHTFQKCFHCSYPPIFSPHKLFTGNSFPQHPLMLPVPCSKSTSLIHISILPRGYYFQNVSTSIIIPDPMTLLTFTADSPISFSISPCLHNNNPDYLTSVTSFIVTP